MELYQLELPLQSKESDQMRSSTKVGIKGFVLGVVMTLLLIVGPVFAATGVIEALLNGVNLMVDGEVVAQMNSNYILSNGEQVPYSILYKGTTYLPVRRLSELLGKEIGYITESKTVVIGAMPMTAEPGWYLTNGEYVLSTSDFDLVGYIGGASLRDRYASVGSEGSYVVTHERYLESQTAPAFASNVKVEYSEVPTYMAAKNRYSIDLSHELLEGDWGAVPAHISFSSTIGIGSGAYGDYSFEDSEGENQISFRAATVTLSKDLHEGQAGDIMYLKVALGHGYGYRYTYEWRD